MKVIKYKNIDFHIGQNATENWELFDKSNNICRDYIWFHLNKFASPYVIMYSSDANDTELMNYGAHLCLQNSKYHYLKDAKILYAPLKKLKKGNKLGEIIVGGKRMLMKVDNEQILLDQKKIEYENEELLN